MSYLTFKNENTFLFRSEPVGGTRQYMLVYPSYQVLTTRQDEAGTTGFFDTIQNYFLNFGNQQSDETAPVMDAIEADKPADAQPLKDPEAEKMKQKLYYSYITPASTIPLNNDRRLFYLAEQPQIYGSFSGSAVNPVFNLQPVPIVLSRSNIAQSVEPNKVVVPPVVAAVQPVQQVQSKSSVVAEHHDVGAVDHHVVGDVPAVKNVGGVNEHHDVVSSVRNVPAVKHHDVLSPVEHHDVPVVKHHEVHGVEHHDESVARHHEEHHDVPVMKQHESAVLQDRVDVPESKSAHVPHSPVEHSLSVSTQSPVTVKSGNVVEARASGIPLAVESSVAPVVPVVDHHVDEIKPAQIGATLKDAHSVVPAAHVDSVPSPALDVQHHVQSDTVEAVTAHV